MRLSALDAAALAVASILVLSTAAPVATRAGRPATSNPAQGKFLIATPHLIDPHFVQTVVLLTHYDERGAMGLVVNRPTEVSIADAIPELTDATRAGDNLYFGGPVLLTGLTLLVETDETPQDARKVFEDVYLSRDRDLLKALVEGDKSGASFRLYAGHAGWGPGQLDAELARGDWLVKTADAHSVFSEDEKLWRHLLPADPLRSAALRPPSNGRSGGQ